MNIKKFAKIISLVLVLCIVMLAGVYTARMFVYRSNDGKDAGTTKVAGSRINILIMATDKGGMLTDTIMFASFNKKTNKINTNKSSPSFHQLSSKNKDFPGY